MLSNVLAGPSADRSEKELPSFDSALTSIHPQTAPAVDSAADLRGLQFLFNDSAARIVADESGKVLWASARAESLTLDNSCLSLTNGILTGRSRHSERLLRELFEETKASQGPVEQLIGRAANEAPELFVHARCSKGEPPLMIGLTFRRLERQLDHLPDLARLYGLTPTEQQIIGLMIQGHSVTEIADELHKSVLTARTHIKRTYLKLQVGTKEQLFSMVMKLMLD